MYGPKSIDTAGDWRNRSYCMNLLQNTHGSDNNDKITQRHKLSRITKNARKLTDVFRYPFEDEYEDDVYNLLTMGVMTETMSKDILE